VKNILIQNVQLLFVFSANNSQLESGFPRAIYVTIFICADFTAFGCFILFHLCFYFYPYKKAVSLKIFAIRTIEARTFEICF